MSDNTAALVYALRTQRQIDEDGCEVGVSRQACDEAADEIERIEREPREKLAVWMLAHSFATGHGDTLDELLGELSWQVNELWAARDAARAEAEALRKEAARADYVRKAFLLDDNDAIFEFCLAESVAEFNAAIDGVLATRTPDAAIAKEQKP